MDIQSNIQNIQDKNIYLQEEIAYLQKFQKPYLESDIYRNHHIHDMWLIDQGEYIIKIDYITHQYEVNQQQSRNPSIKTSTIQLDPKTLKPIDAWRYFRKSIIKS